MKRESAEYGQEARSDSTGNVVAFTSRPTRAERYAMGESLRKK